MTNWYKTGKSYLGRALAVAAMLAGGATTAQAQLAYSASTAVSVAGTYTDVTTGTAITTANFDDANSALTPLGFSFSYNGQTFDNFFLNTNGYIKLATATTTAPAAPYYFPSGATTVGGPLSTAAETNIIAPFNFDLEAGTGTPEYRVVTTGTAPNRVTTIQWRNVSDKITSDGATGTIAKQYSNISFQVKLYETTNVIEFVYAAPTAATAGLDNFKYGAVGIKGSSNTDEIVAIKPSVNAWSTTVFQAGGYPTANSNAHNIRRTAPPDAGRTYRFTPIQPIDAAVIIVYTLDKLPIPYGTPHIMQALVRNVGSSSIATMTVTATVSGANTFTSTKTVTSLAAGASTLVSFDPFSPANVGTNNISATVNATGDGNAANNTQTASQVVNTTNFALANASTTGGSSIGFNTGSGILAVKYNTSAPRQVTSVVVRLEGATTVGNTVYATVHDNAGAILGRTANYTVTTADIGTAKTFTLPSPVNVPAGDFFVGLAQTANTTTGYFPVGSLAENPTRNGAIYSIPLAGGTPADQGPSATNTSNLGRLQIEAVTAAPPTCAAPTGVTISGVTASSATVTFTGPSNGTGYTIIYGPTGFNPATGGTTVTPAPTASPYTISTGLAALTGYDLYIRSNCGATDQSALAGPFAFTTPCVTPTIATYPYTENFDGVTGPALPCGITTADINNDNNTWTNRTTVPTQAGNTPISSTNPNAMVYFWNTNGTTAANDWFFTPGLLMRSGRAYRLSFKYRSAGGAFNEGLEVKVGPNTTPAGQTTTLWSNTAISTATFLTASNTGTPAVVDFVPTANGTNYIGFHAISAADQFFLVVDDVQVSEIILAASPELARAVSVYPNPSAGEFRVDVKGANAQNGLQVEVTNMLGQKVHSATVRDNMSNQLNLSQLASGLYTLRIANGAQYTVQTISIQH